MGEASKLGNCRDTSRLSLFLCVRVHLFRSSTAAHPAAGGSCSRLWHEAKDSAECCDEAAAALLFLFPDARGLDEGFSQSSRALEQEDI